MKKVSSKKLVKYYQKENAELMQDIEDLLSGDETKMCLVKIKYLTLHQINHILSLGWVKEGKLFKRINYGKERS